MIWEVHVGRPRPSAGTLTLVLVGMLAMACGEIDPGVESSSAGLLVVDQQAESAAAQPNLDTPGVDTPGVDIPSARVPLGVVLADAFAAVRAQRMPERRSFTLAFTGDTLMHTSLVNQARRDGGGVTYDFAPMFARLAPTLGAIDLAVCHLETPIAPPGEALSTYPLYGVPAEVTTGLASAGYDRCSTASNHSLDRGTSGIDATVNALQAAGLGQSGMARSAEEAVVPAIFDVNGVRVAHLSYTWSFNGLRLPADQPWRSNLIDAERIVADATNARAAGAEYVVVSCHWGVEGSSQISQYQRDVASAITASGVVDLVVGHHAHVLQPIEQINGRWVVFGLGNLVSGMTTAYWPPEAMDGAIVVLGVAEQVDGSFVTTVPIVLPTYVDREPTVIRNVLDDLADPAIGEPVRSELVASLERTRRIVGAYVPSP
jgi:Bacterial capsule synthesis protein PGA_cap